MRKLRRIVTSLALVAVSTAAIAGSGYQYLNVAEITQEHSNWCWAATSLDMLEWYGMNSSQCDIVDWAFGINDACGNSNFNWNSPINSSNALYGQSGSIQDILSSAGLGTQVYTSALNWNTIVADVNASSPFIIRFGWYGGGGHFLVGYGYYDLQGTQYVGYMNPLPGEGYTWSTYSWTAYAPYDHTWTDSLRTWQ
ncbi:MAG TPA: C39 family peptidase [Rhodanobacteraceae bacterium]